MKSLKIISFSAILITMFAFVTMYASENKSAEYYDMVEGRYYTTQGFYPVDGYAYAKLTNHDDAYGDNYSGDGEVILEKVSDGKNACVSSAVNVKPTYSIRCNKNGLPNSTWYHTKAVWDVVHGSGGSIWSSIK